MKGNTRKASRIEILQVNKVNSAARHSSLTHEASTITHGNFLNFGGQVCRTAQLVYRTVQFVCRTVPYGTVMHKPTFSPFCWLWQPSFTIISCKDQRLSPSYHHFVWASRILGDQVYSYAYIYADWFPWIKGRKPWKTPLKLYPNSTFNQNYLLLILSKFQKPFPYSQNKPRCNP